MINNFDKYYKNLVRLSLTVFLILMSVNILKANIEDDLKMAWRWSSYSLKSGLPSNNVIKIVESSDKTLWVVTPKGFAWFDNFIWHEVVADSAGFTAEEISGFYARQRFRNYGN